MPPKKGAKYNTDHSRMVAEHGKKPCGRCGEVKPLTEFHRTKAKSIGYVSRCKTCTAAVRDRESHNENARRRKYVVRYGITLEERDALVAAQGGRCRICREEKPLLVDHCHKTSVVRGMLCRQCNVVLGHAKDRPDILRAAIEYLEVGNAVENPGS